ncbi:MAG: Hsp70 family protein [Planctomycetes bacterium]|nr:Hsp70 family protein [Planctomycetota bacterium]
MSGPLVGIDLGTTNSAISFLNTFGRAEVIPNLDGEPFTPSVVFFAPAGPPIVGRQARELSHTDAARVAEFFKREMGDPDFAFEVDGKSWNPTQLSAFVLKHLLDSAEARLGARPSAAVITCPAYFGDLERQATMDAGRLAGLEVLSVFNEPTAAALAYGLHHAAKGDRLRALVYDLGGGTFDVTVIELEGRAVRVLATAGEHRLGGKDWDDELLNYVSEEFVRAHGKDPREDLDAIQDLRNRCEAAKVTLSRRSRARVFCRAFGESFKLDVTRGVFDELTRPLLEQTQTYVEEVLGKAKLGWGDLDVILPVGGSSHMPQVRELLARLSNAPIESTLDPELAVARGAAYYAGLIRAEQGFEIQVLSQPKAAGTAEDLPEVFGLPGKVADAPLGALPGRVAQPGALPGQVAQPGALPGRVAQPGALPGQVAQPGALPGQVAQPGALPGRAAPPGALPGQVAQPGALPGQVAQPGALPGQVAQPGALPGRTAAPPAPVTLGALPGMVGGAPAPLPPMPEAPVFAVATKLEPVEIGAPPPMPSPLAQLAGQRGAQVVSLGQALDVAIGGKVPAVTNVNSHSLGVLVFRQGQPRTSIMIGSNSALPVTKRTTFQTINDGQTGVKIVVLEGENPDPDANARIGEAVISGLPPRPKGSPVEVAYHYDRDGRIHVYARDVRSGKSVRTVLERTGAMTRGQHQQFAQAMVRG